MSTGSGAFRTGASLAATGVVAIAWLGPLPGLALERFAAQAALHVVLVSIAGPLLAACIAGSRVDPVRRRPNGFSPLGLSLLQAGVVWAWQMPIAQLALRAEPSLLWLQQASLLLAGLFLWVSVLGGDRSARYERAGAGIIALLMTSISMTLLGGLSLIGRSPYFGAEMAASFDDRRLGALLILAGAAVIYTIAGVLLLAWLVKPGGTVAAPSSRPLTTAGGRS